jgi:hypothetical protein
MKKLLGCLLMILGLVILSAAAWADTGSPESDRWQVTIEPYLWTPQLSGSVTVNNTQEKVKFDLTDYFNIIDEISMILMGRVTIQKDRFAIFYDGMYAKLEDEINSGVTAEITSKQLIQEMGASFEVNQWALGGEAQKNLRLEILGGARHVYLRSEGTAEDPLGVRLENDKTRQWVDPFIGGRLTLGLTELTSISLRGDIGGFGVSSDFIWNGILEARHYFTKNKNWFTTVGYRGMNTDYEDGSFEYKLDYYGPVTSAGFTF